MMSAALARRWPLIEIYLTGREGTLNQVKHMTFPDIMDCLEILRAEQRRDRKQKAEQDRRDAELRRQAGRG